MQIQPRDLASPEAAEGVRRSIAMLSPGQWALRREDALAVLDRLIGALNDDDSA